MSLNSELQLRSARHWAPRREIAPVTGKAGDGTFIVSSNGSAGCYGGWDLTYPAPESPFIRVRTKVRTRDLERGLDSLRAALFWDNGPNAGMNWEPVLPVRIMKTGNIVLECRTPVPQQATRLTLRLLMTCSRTGRIWWSAPEVREAAVPKPRRWRLGAAGGALTGHRSLKKNVETYLGMCREAAAERVDLLCLPEVMLSTGLPSGADSIPKQAIRIPGKETQPFQRFARTHKMALCFSAWERNGELIHNTAILIDKTGKIIGKYRKVHLASPLEAWWGVTPGHQFPVYRLGDARVAMNICMDSSMAESARVPAFLGAEILCMPIMGDHRAVRDWRPGPANFDIDRWIAIQRVRAMDNQLYMVISRNSGYGSGIFSPSGVVLTLSGSVRVVHADIDLADTPRTWTGATFRGVNHWVRRDPAYGPLMSQKEGV